MDLVIPEFAFSSPRDAATLLHGAARRAGVEMHPLPYSRYDPEHTTWWLSRTSDNPAYASGKIIAETSPIVDQGGQNVAIIGFHVEKGIGPKAAAIFEETARGHRSVMQDDWRWHDFAHAMASGVADGALRGAEVAASSFPVVVEIVIAVQFAPERDWDRPTDRPDAERILYQSSNDRLLLRQRQTGAMLEKLDASETLASIARKIDAVADLDWTWIEILAGVPFRPVAGGGMSPDEVWRRACAPWMEWVR
jgi:hypothetical protein